MDDEMSGDKELDGSNKRPGPRLSQCQWCGKVSCNHCRCTGQQNCGHAQGEMCKNQRYKRRLVCNPCEKNKLRHRQLCQRNSDRKSIESSQQQQHRQPTNSANPVNGPVQQPANISKPLSSTPTMSIQGVWQSKLLPVNNISSGYSSQPMTYDRQQNQVLTSSPVGVSTPMPSLEYPTDVPTPAAGTTPQSAVDPAVQITPNSVPSLTSSTNQNSFMPQPVMGRENSYSIDGMTKMGQLSYMGRESDQWGRLTMGDMMQSGINSFPRNLDNNRGFYGGFQHNADGSILNQYMDEDGNNELLRNMSPFPRNSSYGDMGFMMPYNQNQLFKRPSSSSDMSWPVFVKKQNVIGDDEHLLYSHEQIHSGDMHEAQRNSTLSVEDMHASLALSSLKEDRSQHMHRERVEYNGDVSANEKTGINEVGGNVNPSLLASSTPQEKSNSVLCTLSVDIPNGAKINDNVNHSVKTETN